MKASVYIDGFNLYYRRLKRSKHKWINLRLLAEELLEDDDEIGAIKYFTADVTKRAGDEDAPTRQQSLFRTLKTIDGFEIHKGRFLPKTIRRPLLGQEKSFVLVRDTEEKGSDVNLASHLLMDAFKDEFDIAIVMSQDTDLIEPLRMVTESLGKIVVVAWLEKHSQPGKKHKMASTHIRHIQEGMLSRSQFPNPVIGRGGLKIWRPESWGQDEEM